MAEVYAMLLRLLREGITTDIDPNESEYASYAGHREGLEHLPARVASYECFSELVKPGRVHRNSLLSQRDEQLWICL